MRIVSQPVPLPPPQRRNWIANFIVSQTFPTLAGISLGLAYGTYTLMTVLSFVFVVERIKETRGLELEAMKWRLRGGLWLDAAVRGSFCLTSKAIESN
jgi:hypothetical protein